MNTADRITHNALLPRRFERQSISGQYRDHVRIVGLAFLFTTAPAVFRCLRSFVVGGAGLEGIPKGFACVMMPSWAAPSQPSQINPFVETEQQTNNLRWQIRKVSLRPQAIGLDASSGNGTLQNSIRHQL
jgi:hypothetical protein